MERIKSKLDAALFLASVERDRTHESRCGCRRCEDYRFLVALMKHARKVAERMAEKVEVR